MALSQSRGFNPIKDDDAKPTQTQSAPGPELMRTSSARKASSRTPTSPNSGETKLNRTTSFDHTVAGLFGGKKSPSPTSNRSPSPKEEASEILAILNRKKKGDFRGYPIESIVEACHQLKETKEIMGILRSGNNEVDISKYDSLHIVAASMAASHMRDEEYNNLMSSYRV